MPVIVIQTTEESISYCIIQYKPKIYRGHVLISEKFSFLFDPAINFPNAQVVVSKFCRIIAHSKFLNCGLL